MPDITALGVAMAAGHAEGIDAWELEGGEVETVPTDTFLPTTTPEGRRLSHLIMLFTQCFVQNIYFLCRERCEV